MSSKLQNLAIRITLSEVIDWKEIFPNHIYSLVVIEKSRKDVIHSHSAVTLDEPMARTTIMSRIQKRYPELKGNAKISLKKWDGGDDYLNYCCKGLYEEGTPESLYEYRQIGTRIPNMTVFERYQVYWEKNRQMKQRKDKPYVVDWVMEEIQKAREYGVNPTSYDICNFVYRYYREVCDGEVPSNHNVILGTIRKIYFRACDSDEFRKLWVAYMHERLF